MPFWKRQRRPSADEQAAAALPAERSYTAGDAPFTTIFVGRKELYEEGFAFCGPEITAAFEAAGLTIALDDERDPPDGTTVGNDGTITWLWIDERCIIEDYNVYVEFELNDGTMNGLRGLDWDLVAALRQRFQDPTDPERNWQLGEADDGYLLILCRPDQLPAVEQDPQFEGFATINLSGAVEVRRGQDL